MTCVDGPYFQWSSPYGAPTLERDEWFVTRPATEAEMAKIPVAHALKARCFGKITRFRRNMGRYVVDGRDAPDFTSLEDAVKFLESKDRGGKHDEATTGPV